MISDNIWKYIGEDLSSLIKAIRATGDELAELDAEASHLENYRKVKLDELQIDARAKLISNSENVTDKKVEAMARSDSQYKIHLKKMKDVSIERGKKYAEHFELRNALEATFERMRNARAKQYKEGREV